MTGVLSILLLSLSLLVGCLSDVALVHPQDDKGTARHDDDNPLHLRHSSESYDTSLLESSSNSCASLQDCDACASTYTCHWCDSDASCHAKGSIHGCVWGGSCNSTPTPKKENSTCASHTTCSECALASHFCHWCENDNACHAIGSRFGCAVGVDCYSNDRCRRTEAEPLPYVIVTSMPYSIMLVVTGIVAGLIAVMSCCYCCVGNVKGAYDDLATITMAASVAPLSVVGGPNFRASEFQTNLEPHPEEEDEEEDEDDAHHHDESLPRDLSLDDDLANTPSHPVGDGALDNTDLSRPLLHPSMRPDDFYAMNDMSEPRHMRRLYGMCSACYYLSVVTILALALFCVYLYPVGPNYAVCNDAVAWKKIMLEMASLKLDASFEILISVENRNHVNVALDHGGGVFRYDGKQVGTFKIPATLVNATSISDLMILAKFQPDEYQAASIAADYFRSKLVLDADFDAKLRVPAFFDYSFSMSMKDFVVNVNEESDRSMCHCPKWGDNSTLF